MNSATDVEVLTDGSWLVTGGWGRTTTFGAGEANETTPAAYKQGDHFVARYGSDGIFQWVKSAGGPDNDDAGEVDSFADGSFVIAVRTSENAVFGEGETRPPCARSGETGS